MLTNERDGKLSKHGISKGSTITVIGDVAEIDPSACLLFKRKLLIEFHAISAVAGHGQKDFAITSTTGTMVLRTMSMRDRDKWVATIRSAVAKHDGLNSHSGNCVSAETAEANVTHARPTTAFSPRDKSLDHADAEKLPCTNSLDEIGFALEDAEMEHMPAEEPSAMVPMQNNHCLDIRRFQGNSGDWMHQSATVDLASEDDLFLCPYGASVGLAADTMPLREQSAGSAARVPESTTLGFLGSGNSSDKLSLAQLDMPLADADDFDASMFFAEGNSIANMQPAKASQRAVIDLGSVTVPNLYQTPAMPMPVTRNPMGGAQVSSPVLPNPPHYVSPQSSGKPIYGDIFGSFMSPPSMALPYGSNSPQSANPTRLAARSSHPIGQQNYIDDDDEDDEEDDEDVGMGNAGYPYAVTSGLGINKSLGMLEQIKMDTDDNEFLSGNDHAVPMSQSTKPAQLPSVPTTATITALSTTSCDLSLQGWSPFMGNTPPLPVASFNEHAANDTTPTMDSTEVHRSHSGGDSSGKMHEYRYDFDSSRELDEKPVGGFAAKQTPGAMSAALLSTNAQQALGDMRLQKSEANLHISPGNQRVGGHKGSIFKSSTTQTAFDGHYSATGKSASTTQGTQSTIRAKFNDINASKVFASAVGRIGRSRTTAEYRNSSSEANSRRDTEPVVIPQYEHEDQADSEVTRVVKGQVARDAIQRENERDSQERRSGVRRMRRVKSESKVPRLKSIRLRLDGSIVGRQVPSYSEYDDFTPRQSIDVGAIGLPSVAGAGHFAGNKFVPKSPYGCAATVGGQPGGGTLGEDTQRSARSTADVMGEFNEIQSRLKTAEEQKKNEQIKRVFAKEGTDDMRISSIIETRQEIPLALQLQEK
ncbi:hypothetical protein FBU59_001591, partial [Linderina macrospora]